MLDRTKEKIVVIHLPHEKVQNTSNTDLKQVFEIPQLNSQKAYIQSQVNHVRLTHIWNNINKPYKLCFPPTAL